MPSSCQISLHLSRNQVHFMGDHEFSAISNAKSGAFIGTLVFAARWCSKARIGLVTHVESEILMRLLSAFVLVHGISKLMNLVLLEEVPHVIAVECETWAFES